MTARHDGMDRPHIHKADRAALDAALLASRAHLWVCAVCALAQATTQQRGLELGVLGPHLTTTNMADVVPEPLRDQFFRETATLFCDEGQRLDRMLAETAFGEVVFQG